MATADEYAAWIVKNADKKGTPEFDTVAAAYKASKATRAPDALDDPNMAASGESRLTNFAAGAGKAIVDTGRGLGQLVGAVSRDDVAKARAQDAPLLAPAETLPPIQGGRFGIHSGQTPERTIMSPGGAGNFAGSVAMTMAPGLALKGVGAVADLAGAANTAGRLNSAGNVLMAPKTLPQAAVSGATQGLIQPSTSTQETVLNTALGAGAATLVPAATGVYRGVKAVGAAPNTGNAIKDATLTAARDAGYVVPPTQANPTTLNKVVEGVSGKIQTGQAASVKNQAVTNKLTAKALGLPEDTQITKEVLEKVRSDNGGAYEAIKALPGKFKSDTQFQKDIATLGNDYAAAAAEFPEIASNKGIETLQAGLAKDEIGPRAAIEAIKKLRFDAAENFKALGDPGKTALAGAQKDAAKALEDLIERNLLAQDAGNFALNKSGANLPTDHTSLIDNFRKAREMIAKTYTVEKALNSSGNVNAQKLAGQLKRGKPLSGELKQVAEFADQFPKAAQNVDQVGSTLPISPLDAAVAATTAIHDGGAGLAMLGTRPLLRSLMLSRPYQKGMPPLPGNESLLRRIGTGGATAGLLSVAPLVHATQQ